MYKSTLFCAMNKNLLLFSTSTVFGSGYLEYNRDVYAAFFRHCSNLVFVPYARPGGISHEDYSRKAKSAFESGGLHLRGLEEFEDAVSAISSADGIFIGGGNTFVLLDELYKNGLTELIRTRVENGMKYMGSSAGTNVAGLSIGTTNDMPVVYPPSFKALGLVPFNFNPHYIDADPSSTHMGETRETRIKEFHVYNYSPVVGLREGSWLEYKEGKITLGGPHDARIFIRDKQAGEYPPDSDFDFLSGGYDIL